MSCQTHMIGLECWARPVLKFQNEMGKSKPKQHGVAIVTPNCRSKHSSAIMKSCAIYLNFMCHHFAEEVVGIKFRNAKDGIQVTDSGKVTEIFRKQVQARQHIMKCDLE